MGLFIYMTAPPMGLFISMTAPRMGLFISMMAPPIRLFHYHSSSNACDLFDSSVFKSDVRLKDCFFNLTVFLI